jgi:Tfp pilus assembly protein PilO
VARKVSARERRLLVGAAVVLVAYVGARPFLGRLGELGPQSQRLLTEKARVIAAYRQAVGREGAQRAESDALEAAIGAYEGALLPGSTPALAAADLQTRLKELADKAGLKIKSEKILPQAKRDAYLEIPVQIVANGDIRNVRDFLIAVEASSMFIAVQEVSLRTVPRQTRIVETRPPADVNELQASVTLAGLIRAGGP